MVNFIEFVFFIIIFMTFASLEDFQKKKISLYLSDRRSSLIKNPSTKTHPMKNLKQSYNSSGQNKVIHLYPRTMLFFFKLPRTQFKMTIFIITPTSHQNS
jgi:hypothetical protein